MFVGDLTVPFLYSPIIFNVYLLLMCGYVHKGPGASGGQKGVSAPMELELQASRQWVLASKLTSSGKAVRA